MATRIPYAFASTGDTTVVPDTSVGTELSIQSGWSSAYELAPEDAGYREIDRGQHNYLWNAITANIKEWQDQSYPDIVSTVDYPIGSIAVHSGLPYVKFQNNDGAVSDPSLSNDWKVFDGLSEVSPRNNQWNGYLDPEHQSNLPAPNGYPATSGGGGTAYTADQEISHGIFAGASGATVSSDSDGWIVSAGSIYRLYTYTIEQLSDIDINIAPIFIKDELGNRYHVNNSTTGVTVSKPNTTTLRVELDSGIFASLGITKLWRWFDTEKIGYVFELDYKSTVNLLKGILSWKNVTPHRASGVTYLNNSGVKISVAANNDGSALGKIIVYIDGSPITETDQLAGSSGRLGVYFEVPDNSTYRIDFLTSPLALWSELSIRD